MLCHRLQSSIARAISSKKHMFSFAKGGQRSKSFFFTHSPTTIRSLQQQLLKPHPSPKSWTFSPSPLLRYLGRGSQRRGYHYNPHFGNDYYFSPIWVRNAIVYGFIGSCVFVWWKWNQDLSASVWREHNNSSSSSFSAFTIARNRDNDTSIWHDMQANWVCSAENVNEGRWWTVISCAFSHQQLWHLAANMLTWNFAAKTAFSLGLSPLTVVGVSLGSGLAGSFAALLDYQRKGSHVERGGLGASALVCGLCAFVTCRSPSLRCHLMFIPIPLPLWLATAGILAYDTYNMNSAESYIGHAAHIGGTAFGIAFYALRKMIVRF